MTDENATPEKFKIFLSYASASKGRVGTLANALIEEGFDVWWDHAVNPGDDYRAVTEAALEKADAVIVCWTPAACGSDWVLSEADDARQRDKLVPVILTRSDIPKPFDRIYTSDLSQWLGNRETPNYLRLVEVLRAREEGREPVPAPWRSKWISWPNFTIAALGVITVLTNISDVKQLFEGFVNPGASQKQVEDLTVKVDEVQAELVRVRKRTASEELTLRQSILRLLSAQSGARRDAAEQAAGGDIDAALAVLMDAAKESEKAVSDLALVWSDIGALMSTDQRSDAISAYERASVLAPLAPVDALSFVGLLKNVGRLEDAEATLNAMLNDLPQDADPLIAAAALGGLGDILLLRGDYEGAKSAFEQALAISGENEQSWIKAVMIGGLGQATERLGDRSAAAALYQQSLSMLEPYGDTESQAGMLNNLAGLATDQRDLDRGEDFFLRALQLYENAGNDPARARVLNNLGIVERLRGNIVKSDNLHHRALAIFERLKEPIGLGQTHSGLGLNAAARKEFNIADDHLRQSLSFFQEAGARAFVAAQLQNLGMIATEQGDYARAETYGRQALSLFRELGQDRDVVEIENNLRLIGVDPAGN